MTVSVAPGPCSRQTDRRRISTASDRDFSDRPLRNLASVVYAVVTQDAAYDYRYGPGVGNLRYTACQPIASKHDARSDARCRVYNCLE